MQIITKSNTNKQQHKKGAKKPNEYIKRQNQIAQLLAINRVDLPEELKGGKVYRLTPETVSNVIIPNILANRKPYICLVCNRFYSSLFTLGEHYSKLHATDFIKLEPKYYKKQTITEKSKKNKKNNKRAREIGKGSLYKSLITKISATKWNQVK